jgi:hypothetical protein
MFMSYIVYSGLSDLRDAIRDDFEDTGYQFVTAETPEAAEAIAEGEYVTIDYSGGNTATVAEVPHLSPKSIPVPLDRRGAIHAYLARELIRAYIEGESAAYVAELEADAAELAERRPRAAE